MSAEAWREKTVRGLSWSLAGSVVRQLLTFALGVWMARLLTPVEFGLMSILLFFSGVATLVVDQGFGAAIIQRGEADDSLADTVFWANLAFAALFSAALVSLGPAFAAFFGEPLLAPLSSLMAVNHFVASFAVVPLSILRREMRFKPQAAVDWIALAVSGGTGLWLAATGHGVWSLAWQLVALSASTSVLIWIAGGWCPRLRFDAGSIAHIREFSGPLLGFNLLSYLERRFDNFLIGRFLGTYPLGLYARAYSVMLFPVSQLSWVASRVMFPALSAIRTDLERVGRVYLKSVQAIAFVSFPLMAGLFVTARPFVLALFGPKWEGMTLILQILCVEGMTQSVSTTTGWLYTSQGRTDLQLKWGTLFATITLLSFVAGVRWGTTGVAVFYVLSDVLTIYWMWDVPAKLVGLSFGRMAFAVKGPFFASVVMAAGVAALGLILPEGWSPWMTLLVQAACGIALYLAIALTFRFKAYQAFNELLMAMQRPDA